MDVEEGRDMGSSGGSDCRPSSIERAVLKEGRSRTCSRLCSMDAGRYTGASVDAVVAVGGRNGG